MLGSLIGGLIGSCLGFYYWHVGMRLFSICDDEFESKKQFWLAMIPFQCWVNKLLNKYRDLK